MMERFMDCGCNVGRGRGMTGAFVAAVALSALSNGASAADAGLAQKLANPVAALISVPFQFNYDDGIGPVDDGSRSVLNVQPVIPFSLGEDWNIISRTIVPLIDQSDIFPGAGSQSGLGDTIQSLFLSPKAPTAGGIIWGVGPVFLLPTATDDLLGTGKWGIGPTGVVLKQQGPWTVGGLANHIWSVAGDEDRADVSQTFLQPFVSYTTPDAWTYTLQTESTYNWEIEEWAVPVSAVVAKVVTLGGRPVSVFGGARYWAESPDGGPEGWGLRFGVTLLFPKG
jgi:hypothetical protein